MSFLTERIYNNTAIAECFSDTALVGSMVQVEAALARAQETVDMVPKGLGEAVAGVKIAGDTLAEGIAQAGVPVPALLAEMRAALDPEAADWLHYGATSQDILDTAMVLRARDALDGLEAKLGDVIGALNDVATSNLGIPMLGRTRGQLATPISFALRVGSWASPLIALEAELPALRQSALRLQMGGSSGSLSTMAPHGAAICAAMAMELQLANTPPWHADRGPFLAMASWLTRLVTALAKMGRDVAISSRGEVAELRAGTGGGSSTMPHKSNPVTAEALQSAHPVAIACQNGLSSAAIHAEERDGASWAVEWKLLPELFEITGSALAHAQTLAETMAPNAAAMRARIDRTPDVMAEAAVFALAASMGRQAASAAVKEAMANGTSLSELSADIPDADMLADIADKAAIRVFERRK
ncbi:MAG: lyase family protein [Pseudomonadota bacterium]